MLWVPQNPIKQGPCPHLLGLNAGFSFWETNFHRSKEAGKKAYEEEAGAGDAQPPASPHRDSFARVSVGTNLISLGLGALLVS